MGAIRGRRLIRSAPGRYSRRCGPKWRNGRRGGLKHRWGRPRVSSSLTFGTMIGPERICRLNKGSGTVTFTGTMSGNTIGTTGVVGSGSAEATGIVIGSRGAGGSHTVLVTNDNIRQYFARGIIAEAGEGAADLNVTVTSNTVTEFANAINSLHGIHFDIGINASDTSDACISVSGNSVATAGDEAGGGADIRLRKHPSAAVSVRSPNLVGSTSTNVADLIAANNPTATTVTVDGAGFTGGATP